LYDIPLRYPSYIPKTPNAYGIANMSAMGLSNLSSYGMNGIGQSINGVGLTNMNGIPFLNIMNTTLGIPGPIKMSGMPNIGGMQGFQVLPGMSSIPGMNAMNGMNYSGFPMFNPSLNGFMPNGTAYSNYFQANLNSQAKSL
jgi:hypothetical protein